MYKLTAPLTPQLLDELSGWEVVPAPLWRTFTGHCEGEWLGQYAAYTPYGGEVTRQQAHGGMRCWPALRNTQSKYSMKMRHCWVAVDY